VSYALQALVVIRLDARLGDWVGVAAIAKALDLRAATIADCLDQMAESGEWLGLELRREVHSEPRPLDFPDSVIAAVEAARIVQRPES
jgi:hypothetical protein